MKTRLDVLPTRVDSAAANMATDFLLLRRYPEKGYARFRAYGWHRAAFSFGYGQKIAWVRAQLPVEAEQGRAVELVRRPTGGGLVDHREDWTYSLVIPRGHDLEAARAVESYRAVHAALAEALRECGQAAVLKESCEPPSETECAATKGPTVCFARPELYDVVHPESGAKIAGAAQKRTKEGLLFQGSIWRPAAGGVKDWEALSAAFVARLAQALNADAQEVPWPDFPEGELDGLVEQYGAEEWTEHR